MPMKDVGCRHSRRQLQGGAVVIEGGTARNEDNSRRYVFALVFGNGDIYATGSAKFLHLRRNKRAAKWHKIVPVFGSFVQGPKPLKAGLGLKNFNLNLRFPFFNGVPAGFAHGREELIWAFVYIKHPG